jgi:4-aminobutyrate aminotransferase-like enzyme
MLPPLTVTPEEIAQAAAILERALQEVESKSEVRT